MRRIQHYIVYYSNAAFPPIPKLGFLSLDKAYHVGGQFDLGYAAGLDACCEKFAEYYEKTTKQYIRDEDIIAWWEDNKNE